jgi:hypothetical protein
MKRTAKVRPIASGRALLLAATLMTGAGAHANVTNEIWPEDKSQATMTTYYLFGARRVQLAFQLFGPTLEHRTGRRSIGHRRGPLHRR